MLQVKCGKENGKAEQEFILRDGTFDVNEDEKRKRDEEEGEKNR